MIKLPFHLDGFVPFHIISLARSATNCTPSGMKYEVWDIIGSLQHFSNYFRGPSSFAIFHFDNNFHHHFNSYEYGKANNRVCSHVLRVPRELFVQKTLIVLLPSNLLGLIVNRLPESPLTHLSPTTSWLSLLVLKFWRCHSFQVLGLRTSSVQQSSLLCKLYVSYFIWPVGIVLC